MSDDVVRTWPQDSGAPLVGGHFRSLISMLSAVEITLADALAHLSAQAVELITATDAACVVLDREDGSREVVATAALASATDDLQARLGEGPTLDAALRQRLVVSGHLHDEQRWPQLAAHLRPRGVRSVLALPLRASHRALGTLSLYAFAGTAFDDHSRLLGLRFARQAAQTVQDALVLDRAQRLTYQLHLGEGDRSEVDRAIAVLMAENGVREDEAYGVLRLLGRTEREDLVTVARAIVAAGATELGPPGAI